MARWNSYRWTALRGAAAHLRGDERGVSAVEFAMLLPLIVTIYFGVVEVSQAVSIDRKVSLTARAVADLVAQSTAVSNTDKSNILAAASAVAAPYGSSKLKVVISSLKVDANKKATVDWSDALNTDARPKGQNVTIPSGLATANTYLIYAEVTYNYTPTVGYVITGSIKLSDQMYMTARLNSCVTRPPAVTACTT